MASRREFAAPAPVTRDTPVRRPPCGKSVAYRRPFFTLRPCSRGGAPLEPTGDQHRQAAAQRTTRHAKMQQSGGAGAVPSLYRRSARRAVLDAVGAAPTASVPDVDSLSEAANSRGGNRRMSKYKNLTKIGEGTYGVVYKATNSETGRLCALKKIRILDDDDGFPSSALREIALLKEVSQHRSIVLLEEVTYIRQRLYLVFEYLDMDLKRYIRGVPAPLSPLLVKSYLHQLVSGIAYCHSRRIIHRDLKPENLLLDAAGALKIADFGLARAFAVPLRAYSSNVVTLWYRAPEILLGLSPYSTPVDLWSVGCIMAEMCTRTPLFPGDSEIDQLYQIFRVTGTPNENVWPGVSNLPYYNPLFPTWEAQPLAALFPDLEPQALDLLGRLLCLDPSRRISAREAVQHPFFDEVADCSDGENGLRNPGSVVAISLIP